MKPALDRLGIFYDQRNPAEMDAFECVGISLGDLLGNIFGIPFDPDYLYSLAFYIQGFTPADTGVNPYAAMCAAIVFGCLPESADTIKAPQYNELYRANFQNFTKDQISLAKKYAQNGVRSLGSMVEIANFMQQYQRGVALTMKWYPQYLSPVDGSLPIVTPSNQYSEHEVVVYDYDSQKGLLLKPHLGNQYGLDGYVWMPPLVFLQSFLGAASFDPTAWRWMSLARICLRYPHIIFEALPQLENDGTIPA